MSAAGVVSFTIPEIKELSQEALIRAGLSAEDAATITEVPWFPVDTVDFGADEGSEDRRDHN